jgi:hypothetical protein
VVHPKRPCKPHTCSSTNITRIEVPFDAPSIRRARIHIYLFRLKFSGSRDKRGIYRQSEVMGKWTHHRTKRLYTLSPQCYVYVVTRRNAISANSRACNPQSKAEAIVQAAYVCHHHQTKTTVSVRISRLAHKEHQTPGDSFETCRLMRNHL